MNRLPDSAPRYCAGHDGGRWDPAPFEIVATWPSGYCAENLAIDRDGNVFVSLQAHKRIDRYDAATRSTTTFARLPAAVSGLAFDADDILWASGGTPGKTPGYVWRIDRAGVVKEWLQIPDAPFMKGCAVHPGGKTLLVCEASTGRVLAVDLKDASWFAWMSDDLLRPENSQAPGVSGVKISQGALWLAVTDRNLLLRVPVAEDGSAGGAEIAAQNLRAADFAIGESGALYLATQAAQTVMCLSPDGARATIAGPEEGAVGSTSCAFGQSPTDETALYVTTSGGLSAPYRGAVQEAKLLRLEVGEPGLVALI